MKLADFFGVTLEEFRADPAVSDNDKMELSNTLSMANDKAWREKLELNLDFGSNRDITVPIWGEAAAATNGQDAFPDQESFETMEIPAGTGAITVRGDSMNPLVWSGQKVFLRPVYEEPKKGDLVVVWTRESGTLRHYFKRWVGRTDEGVELESVNKGEGIQEKTVVAAEDFGSVRIIIGVWYG